MLKDRTGATRTRRSIARARASRQPVGSGQPRAWPLDIYSGIAATATMPPAGTYTPYAYAGLVGQLSAMLTNDPEPDKIPAYLMQDLATRLGADSVYLLRLDAATQTLAPTAWAVVDGAIQHRDSMPALLPSPPASLSAPGGTPPIARYSLLQGERPYLCPDSAALFRGQGHQIGLTLPLLAGQQTLGFLKCMSRDSGAFQGATIELARVLAAQLTLVLQCAWLSEQAARAAVLRERERIAQDIHDTIGQAFTAILVQLRGADALLDHSPKQARAALEQVREIARDGLNDTRRVVDALRPQAPERTDLALALRRLLVQSTIGTAMDVQFRVEGAAFALPQDIATHLLRICQEALSNSLKYAGARQLSISLRFDAQQLQIRLHDDGRGFDPALATASGGFGLLSMRARALTIGAEIDIRSAAGQGTSLSITLPRSAGAEL